METTDLEPPKDPGQSDEFAPNGMHLGIVQLERDLKPWPASQRIIQWFNNNGILKAYITESAYHRTECKGWFDKLFRDSYTNSIAKGSKALLPVKSKIHWHRFEPAFLTGENLDTPRINPETDEEE